MCPEYSVTYLAGRTVGTVLVLEKKTMPLPMATERLRQQTSKGNEPGEAWTDPRGVDPNAEPPRQREDNPWGRTPGVGWGVRAG
jgi:hypothetical protein